MNTKLANTVITVPLQLMAQGGCLECYCEKFVCIFSLAGSSALSKTGDGNDDFRMKPDSIREGYMTKVGRSYF